MVCQLLIFLLYFITNCKKCVFLSAVAFVRIVDENLEFASKGKSDLPLGVLIFDRDRLSVSPIQRSFRGRGLSSRDAHCAGEQTGNF